MLSNRMYIVLSAFPRSFSKGIKYEDLLGKCKLSKDEIDECLNETLFPQWNYIRSSNGFNIGSHLYLTESGLVGIEAHEAAVEDKHLVQRSLAVSNAALWASIISAVTAFLSLIPQIINWLTTFVQ